MLWRDDHAQSKVALGLVGAMGLLAILSLLRVFDSPAYLAWGIPGVAVGAVFALTYGKRSLGVSFLLLIVVCVVTLPALFARDLTTALFPSRAAWRLVWALLESGFSGIVNEESPVPVSPRYLVVLWVAALAGGFLGASWIVVGRPLGALLTATGLVAFSGQVGSGRGRDLFGFGVVAVLGGFLLTDGRHRIANWSVPRRPVVSHLGAGSLAAASLLALIGPVVLGSATPLFELTTVLRPRVVVIKPLSDVQRQLHIEPPVEVLRVRSPIPSYWRLTALNQYTGTEWLLEARPEPAKDGIVAEPEPPTQGPVLQQNYRITSLLAPWLPASYAALEVDSPVPFDVDEETSTLLLDDETLPGLNYSVTSRLPNSEAISKVVEPAGRPDSDAAAFARLAAPIVANATTAYEQALAIQNHFRGFRYDDEVDGGHDVQRLQRFFNERVGYCEQFAATMVLMLRGLGTPARVAVGFLPGGVNSAGEFVVTTEEAHAWVEAMIPGMGWVPFDPTPGRGLPAGGQPQEVAAAQPEPVPAAPSPEPQASLEPEEEGAGEGAGGGIQIPWRTLAYLAVIAAIVGVVPSAKAWRRSRRRSGSPRESVLGAWAELLDGLRDLGIRQRAAETQWELWDRAFQRGRAPGGDAASRVVALAGQTMYGPGDVTPEQAGQAWTDVRDALKQLRSTNNWWVRTRATFDPRTFIPRVLPFVQQTARA